MEMMTAQILMDANTANWVVAVLITILLVIVKRSGDAADRREKKIDEILEKQQSQLHSHELMLTRHSERIEGFESDISKSNKDILDNIYDKLGALDFTKKSRYDK